MIQTFFLILVAAILIPIVVYLSTKLGVYAYYRAKSLFEKETEDGKAKEK